MAKMTMGIGSRVPNIHIVGQRQLDAGGLLSQPWPKDARTQRMTQFRAAVIAALQFTLLDAATLRGLQPSAAALFARALGHTVLGYKLPDGVFSYIAANASVPCEVCRKSATRRVGIWGWCTAHRAEAEAQLAKWRAMDVAYQQERDAYWREVEQWRKRKDHKLAYCRGHLAPR